MRDEYELNEDERAIAYRAGQLRREKSHGPAYVGDGDEARLLRLDYVAAMGEIATSRCFNLCWTGCGRGNGARPARDVGDLIEVRSILDPIRGLLARPKCDDEAPCVLVWVQPMSNGRLGHCKLLGWQWFAEVKRRGFIWNEGTEYQCWILPQEDLLALDELYDWAMERCHVR